MSTHANESWRPEDTFAVRLAAVRTAKGWNVLQAATACGISNQTWHNWEAGRQPQNFPAVVAKIALALGVDRDWLMWGGPLESRFQVTTGRYLGDSRQLLESDLALSGAA